MNDTELTDSDVPRLWNDTNITYLHIQVVTLSAEAVLKPKMSSVSILRCV